VDYALAAMPTDDMIWQYLKMGFEHILPLGLDHILFVVCLYLLNKNLSSVLWQASAFTVAHSVTLALAAYGYIRPLPAIVEPIIALSIFFVAVENLLVRELRPARLGLVFLFGLVHGMGFAGALADIGLPPGAYFPALLSFNIGVELGQVAVILLLYLLMGRWFSTRSWYVGRVVQPVSLLIAAIALFWVFERTF
jgi:hypothetical protein